MSKDLKKGIMGRVYIAFGFIAFGALMILGRIIYIQVYLGDELESIAKKQSYKTETVKAVRGNIYSSKNELLATSVPIYELRWDSKIISQDMFEQNIDSLAYYINKLYPEVKASDFKRKMQKAHRKGNRYFLIRRGVEHAELKKIKKMPIFRLGKYKGGLIVEKQDRRKRPYKMLAKRTIGIFCRVLDSC